MKRILKITLLVVTVACGTGCATGYWVDRGRDAADVFTATVGCGVGAKGRLGPINVGLAFDSTIAGVRGGKGFMSSPKDLEVAGL